MNIKMAYPCGKCKFDVIYKPCCDSCNKWHHFECTCLSNKEFTHLSENDTKWYCTACKTCKQCKMINGKSICCDNCKNWFDIKCSKIGNGDEFEALSISENEWQCKICTKEIFPFHDLYNKKFKALLGTQGTQNLTKNKNNTHNLKPNEPQVALPKLNFAQYKRDKYDFYSILITDSKFFLAGTLCKLFNKSIQDHCFPSDLKFAKVLPSHKGKSKMDCKNYRPVSVLPIFSKIMERLMYNRLLSFIKKHDILYEHQYGFQAGKSTELAINSLLGNITEAFGNHLGM